MFPGRIKIVTRLSKITKRNLNAIKKKTCQDLILLKNAMARARLTTKNSKTLLWQEFTSSINQKTSTK